jgi:hypothetical protein
MGLLAPDSPANGQENSGDGRLAWGADGGRCWAPSRVAVRLRPSDRHQANFLTGSGRHRRPSHLQRGCTALWSMLFSAARHESAGCV